MQQHHTPPFQRRQQTTDPSWKIELPIDRPCQIYPRVSTPEQRKNVSAEMQKDKSFAILCGWIDDGMNIILDDRDLGVSGQLRMEDRPAFSAMLRRIASQTIGAVIACNVDRLFRNKWGDEPGKFMEICYEHNVLVVTPDFVYDFRINWHIERFKRRCEEAWNYLEYHVYGRLHPAQDERGYAGYWTGGNLPMGYILDVREKINGVKNPDYYRYIVYEPHARVIRWIFRRFKELNGCVMELMREIESKPFLFPDFDESVDKYTRSAFTQYTKVPGGYTIASDAGLRHLLKNRVYIGYWVYKNELVRTDNHEPIVDLETFTYAYTRLSHTMLDGTPNEDAVEGRGRRHIKRHFADRPALLKECINATDPDVRIYCREYVVKGGVRMYYGFYPRGVGRVRASASSVIAAADLDAVVLEKLKEHLRTPQSENDFKDFKEEEEEVLREASETLLDIERDIKATKALMARVLEQIKSGKLTEPDLLDAANESYARAKVELARLEARKKETAQIASEDEERRSYKKLMQDVGDAWDEVVTPEEHPRLVYLFIKSVTLEHLSPLFFSLHIQWRDPSWGIDCGLCYRGGQTAVEWTEEEIAILLEHFETAPRSKLMELLPRRGYQGMKNYVRDRHLPLPRQAPREPDVPHLVSLEDWKIMQEHALTERMLRSERCVKIVKWDFPLLL